MPGKATSKWWKEERVGVFLDYNQNARDRTVASAYSVRPVARRARLDAALRWDEVPDVEAGRPAARHRPAAPARTRRPDRPTIDDVAHCASTPLLELARRDEEEGLGDAPWPPNFAKQPGEPKRVQPSRAKKD